MYCFLLKEFLSDLLDSLHEDCNKIVSKPAVEPLHDAWVRNNSLQTVGEATWRRYVLALKASANDLLIDLTIFYPMKDSSEETTP